MNNNDDSKIELGASRTGGTVDLEVTHVIMEGLDHESLSALPPSFTLLHDKQLASRVSPDHARMLPTHSYKCLWKSEWRTEWGP